MKIDIRQANAADKDGIWKVLSAAVEDGNSCVYSGYPRKVGQKVLNS
jgi:hypothetical protein